MWVVVDAVPAVVTADDEVPHPITRPYDVVAGATRYPVVAEVALHNIVVPAALDPVIAPPAEDSVVAVIAVEVVVSSPSGPGSFSRLRPFSLPRGCLRGADEGKLLTGRARTKKR
jgi:hypothetical protein